MVLEEIRNGEIIDLVKDDEKTLGKEKKEKKDKKEKKITDHFPYGKSKSVVARPAMAASW